MNAKLKEFIAMSAYGSKCLKTSDSKMICVRFYEQKVDLMVWTDGLDFCIRKKGSRDPQHRCWVYDVTKMNSDAVKAIDCRIAFMLGTYATVKPKAEPVMQTPQTPSGVLTYYVAGRLKNTVGVSNVEFWSDRRPTESTFACCWGTTFTFMNQEFLLWFDYQNKLMLHAYTGKSTAHKDLTDQIVGCTRSYIANINFDVILSSVLDACKRFAESQDKAVKIKRAQSDLENLCKRYGITKADLLGKEAK